MSNGSSVADTVINRFGGLTAFATALGHNNPTTVQGWKERGRIPLLQWPAIERAASAKGFSDITLSWLALAHAEHARSREKMGAA